MRRLIKQGKLSEGNVALGWLEAIEWMTVLPKSMLSEVSKKEE